MGTALLALCFCALSLVLALFVGISPIIIPPDIQTTA